MKKIKASLFSVACILAVSAAFAFSDSKDDCGYIYVDGKLVQQLPGTYFCNPVGDICTYKSDGTICEPGTFVPNPPAAK